MKLYIAKSHALGWCSYSVGQALHLLLGEQFDSWGESDIEEHPDFLLPTEDSSEEDECQDIKL